MCALLFLAKKTMHQLSLCAAFAQFVAMAAIFLASKLDEAPRKLKDVIGHYEAVQARRKLTPDSEVRFFCLEIVLPRLPHVPRVSTGVRCVPNEALHERKDIAADH
jgi:hypothetical protein